MGQHDPRQNRLIAALPAIEFERLRPALELVELPLGSALYESGGLLRHALFPSTSIVSLLYVMEDGASAEVAVVDYEGLVGVALFLGGQTMPNCAIVQSAGHGSRIEHEHLLREFGRASSSCCCATHRRS